MERSVKDMRDDCADAFQRALPYHSELQQIYRYMMPWRQSTIERAREGGGQTEGASITDYIFDATGISAAANFSVTLSEDWMPLNQDFFKLEAGPFLPEGADKHELDILYANVTKRIHAVSARPQVTALETFYDYFAGTGAMFLGKGNSRTIANSVAVPVVELALDNGPWGDVWHIYWKRTYRHRDLPELWPDGTFSDELAKLIKEKPRDKLEVVQYTHYDAKQDLWLYDVWCDKEKDANARIWTETLRTNPWMTPRMYLMPGETFARGLGHLALPFVKTANRGRELDLKAAIFAILGVWVRRNDSVFNPETAVFDPGAMWAVSQTGGPFASLARLPVPQNFDISRLVQQEEREQIRRVLLDDELPDESDPIRSPTEIAARLRRYARRRGGTGARLGLELVTPYAQRMCDILEQHQLLPTRITIDQIVTKCTVTAPAAAGQRTGSAEAWINYMQVISMLFGPHIAMLLAQVKSIPELGRNLGVAEEHLPGKEDLQKIEHVLAQAAAQQVMAQKEGPQPNGASAAAPLVNGGAL